MGHDHQHHHQTGHTSDRGSRITLVGLLVNIALSGVKATAGLLLNSASLVADAAHSLSDLFGDFVVLIAWKLSRRPPNDAYPYGYGKYEPLGAAVVSVLLLTGGIGIGVHSYSLLFPQPEAHTAHHHHHSEALDPNAAWFALGSVLVKEYLYRITKKVAQEEKSGVLMANALHHRSDAFSGIIALAAIITSYFGVSVADPVGGLVVAGMIAKQGISMFLAALFELLDASIDPSLPGKLQHLFESNEHSLQPGGSVKILRTGSLTRAEVRAATLDPTSTLGDLWQLEKNLSKLAQEFTDGQVAEVLVRPRPS